ncbi:MAG: helicase, partial [Mesorhizobium sp.]
ERVELLRRLGRLQALAQGIDAGESLGKFVFGSSWHGRGSDWAALTQAELWLKENGSIRHLAARLPERIEIANSARSAREAAQAAARELKALTGDLKADAPSLFGVVDFPDVAIGEVVSRLQGWLDHQEQLSKWVAYEERSETARKAGLGQLIDGLANGQITTGSARSVFDMAYYERMFLAMATDEPELARFDGELHSRAVRDFADLDRQRIKAGAIEVVTAHHRKIPSRDGGAGPVGLLRSEMARRRG